MKVIDEKGRLFGKINIIDFLVILFLVSFLPMLYFAVKLYKKPPVLKIENEEKEFIEIDVSCSLIKIKPGLLQLIAIGDKEVNSKGEIIGEIIQIREAKPYKYEFTIGSGQVITKDSADLTELPVTLKLKLEVRGNNVYYKDKQLSIESPLLFKTEKYALTAVIPVIKLREESKEKLKGKWIKAMIKCQNIIHELAGKVSDGDYEKEPSTGEKVGVIEKIISKKPSDELVLKIEENKFIQISNPAYEEMTVSVRLFCSERHQGFFYNDQSVKIGKSITFETKKYSISGKIIELDLE